MPVTKDADDLPRDDFAAANASAIATPGSTVAAYAAIAVLTSTALTGLWAHRLAARRGESSIPRAIGSMQRWCRQAWPWLRLDVRTYGSAPVGPCVYVANHRSYLDIVVLAGALGATFLSRADVAGWPLVGAVAKETGTVFVDRDDLRGRVRAARALTRRAGACSVIVFPEGTTGGECLPRAFHPGLFRLLARLTIPVVPVTVRYSDRRAYWTEDIGLWEHLRTRVFSHSTLRAAVHIAPALQGAPSHDGTSLQRAAYEAVCRPIAELGELVGTS